LMNVLFFIFNRSSWDAAAGGDLPGQMGSVGCEGSNVKGWM
jgi:hypothetical protein